MPSAVQRAFSAALAQAPIYQDPLFATRCEPPVPKNTVCTVFYGIRIDLKKLLNAYPHCQYDPTNFAALMFRLTPAKSLLLTFAAGHCVLLGCRTENEVQVCARLYARMLEQTGHKLERYVIRNRNTIMSVNMPYRIDLRRLHAVHKGISCYNPEVFSGLIIRYEDLKVTVTCFESGKFNVVGFSKYEKGLEAYKRVMEILPNFPEVKKLVQTKTPSANDRKIAKKLEKATNASLEALKSTLINKEEPKKKTRKAVDVPQEAPMTPRTRKRQRIVETFSQQPSKRSQTFQEFYAGQSVDPAIGKSIFSAAMASRQSPAPPKTADVFVAAPKVQERTASPAPREAPINQNPLARIVQQKKTTKVAYGRFLK